MSIFDVFENKKRTHEKVYGEHVKKGYKSRWFADVVHDFKHGPPMFGKRSTYDKSANAGYHEGRRRRKQREKESVHRAASTHTGSSSDSSPKDVPLKICAVIVIIAFIYFFLPPIILGPRAPDTGTIRQINANELNLRAGPGKKHAIVQVFHKNDQIVTFGNEVEGDGLIWIEATTLDGRFSGWIWKDWLSR